ncbi:MAG TPA: hypothetical protein PLB01_13370, partial [Thermoanaerobaculia bacterium]|nr:hypothetical protein [Thermoanaerobaculia bacterium]
MAAPVFASGGSAAARVVGGAAPSPSPSKKSPSSFLLPQRLAARLTGSPWFWAVFVFAVFAVPVFRSVTRPLPAAPPVLGELPAFALTDQQ